jgi:hypothetical protein
MRFRLELNVNDVHGHITSNLDVADKLRCVANQLELRYGSDAVTNTGIDLNITADDGLCAVVGRYAVVEGKAWDPAPLPSWLTEAVLSMEHDHNPAVRYCGDQLRKRLESK